MAKKLDLMDRSIPVWKLILTLAWPTIVEQLLQTAVNYVDTAMVGSIGTGATAAIGVTTTTIWLINGLMNGLGVGFSVMVARRIGEGRFEDARAIIRQAMLATVAMGLFLTAAVELVVAPNLPRWMGAEADVIPQAVGYFRTIGAVYLFNMGLVMGSGILRCTGDTKTPLKYNLMTNVINVVGNFLLIYPTREIQVEYGDGLRECKKMLMMAKAGKRNGFLLEGMGCPGGCVAGAGMIAPVKDSTTNVERFKNAAAVQSTTESPYLDRLKDVEESC